MTGYRVERRLAAVLAADIAGYSRLMGADEEGTLSRLDREYQAEAIGGVEIFPCRGRGDSSLDKRLTSWWETASALGPFQFRSIIRGLPSNREPARLKRK